MAGCTGDGGDGGQDTVPGNDFPAVDDWLTETDVGGADDTYEGTLVDLRDQDTVTIGVGTEGNGDDFAFGPSAVLVSAGTEVVWDWTGDGGRHNVEAEPDDQLGESDYEFSSGEPTQSADTEYRRTLDEAGVVLYHCEPHLSVGMKGGIAIE
ncbi:halocyanin domain-containing protein [Haloglomus litoreum]|uniref:halocyanin domain-containing protein n=1 Tax=Haloglomus litoreum TaxID=3034026 RepID=UPI0023E7D3FE|nr:halocyanin domain-containing protein [Haloglomus sp. DT116]